MELKKNFELKGKEKEKDLTREERKRVDEPSGIDEKYSYSDDSESDDDRKAKNVKMKRRIIQKLIGKKFVKEYEQAKLEVRHELLMSKFNDLWEQ